VRIPQYNGYYYSRATWQICSDNQGVVLTESRSFLALAAYPAIIICVLNWWSAASRWSRKNRSFYLPPDIKVIEER
jgi:hypothetical protein